MIGYVTIGTDDFDKALPFYDGVFEAIGGERKSFEGGWAFYGPTDGEGSVGVCKPFNGEPARVTISTSKNAAVDMESKLLSASYGSALNSDCAIAVLLPVISSV